jgi:hypothetical protein
MISGFHYGVNEIFSILGFYAAHILVSCSGLLCSYRRFGTSRLSRNVGKKGFKIRLYIISMKLHCWLLPRWVTAWVIVSFETSHCLVEIFHTVRCHIPEVIICCTNHSREFLWFCWEGAVRQEENLCDLMCQHSDMSDIRHNMHYRCFGSSIFHLRVLVSQ